MITIVDYGVGNLGSILNMFKRIGAAAEIASTVAGVERASKILLPGVGAFDAAMQCINQSGLRDVLQDKAKRERVPTLGVCLGMQLLTQGSEEGQLPGLGWIPASTKRFQGLGGLKVPHIGWNTVKEVNGHPLTAGLPVDARFYFVHSYCVEVDDQRHAVMKTSYGIEFDAIVAHENIMGAQFHPEKSHRFGMHLLANFASL